MKGKTRIDWARVRTSYISGEGSYRELAARFGVSLNTLEKIAKREDWAWQRRQVYGKLAAELADEVSEVLKKDLAEHFAGALSALDYALGVTLAKMEPGELDFRSLGEAMAALTRIVKTKADVTLAASDQGVITNRAGRAASSQRSMVVYLPAKSELWRQLDREGE